VKRPLRWAVVILCAMAAACSRAELDAIVGPASGDAGGAADGGPGSCPATPPAGDTAQTIQVGGIERSYLLHVPATYDGTKPAPLLVDLHALAGSGPQERKLSSYPPVTDADGALMVFPNGLPGPSGNGWNVGPCCVPNADDVAFIKALVVQLRATTCIDAKRVYATGFSMGGGMAHYLACQAADVFAAVAPSAFDLLQENAGGCQPTRPITVISFRGSADTLVPYAGGYSTVVPGLPVTFLGAQGTFQKWAEIDGCSGTPSAPDTAGCSTYRNCQGSAEVTLCTKQGGGQEWGNAAIAWPVLKRHALP
jgi:polyhydroxybutyrate depolymerase